MVNAEVVELIRQAESHLTGEGAGIHIEDRWRRKVWNTVQELGGVKVVFDKDDQELKEICMRIISASGLPHVTTVGPVDPEQHGRGPLHGRRHDPLQRTFQLSNVNLEEQKRQYQADLARYARPLKPWEK